MGVAVLDGAEQLPQALLALEWVHAVGVALEVLEDGALDKLKDQVQLALASEDLDQVDDVVVLELLRRYGKACCWVLGARRIEGPGELMPGGSAQRCLRETHLQDANFAKRSLADLLVLVRLLELLDRNDLPSLLVACLEDNAIRSARRKRRLSTASLVRGGRGSARTPPRSCPAPRSSPFSPEALED